MQRKDSKSSIGSKKHSAIEQTSLINEIIKRENKFHSINKVFTLNLKRLRIIALKPNYIKKEHLDLDKRASEIPESIAEKIKHHLFKIPNEKYPFPLTSSHDFGWEKGEKLNKNQVRHPKFGCDVTRYADEYFALKGRSPYATKDPIKNPQKK